MAGTEAPGRQAGTLRAGYAAIVFTVGVWGFTFVSTKVLLEDLLPGEILLIRFVIGLVVLTLMRPRLMRLRTRRHEGYFVLAGLTGITLYYLLENMALVHLGAALTAIVVSVAPLFTAAIGAATGQERNLGARFFAGAVIATAGVVLVSVGGAEAGGLAFEEGVAGWTGVGMCIAAAFVWGVYSNVVAKIASLGYETIQATRRSFFWGIVFMVALLPVLGVRPDCLALALEPVNAGNLAFLGVVASATCFATWGFSVKRLGPARTSTFIYVQPALTAAASAVILREPFTPLICLGIVLTLAGLVLSQRR